MNDAESKSDLQPTATPGIPTSEIPASEFSPTVPAKAPELSGVELRLKQIEEYRAHASRYHNRLTANIRRADADLMDVAALVADRLREVLKSGPESEDIAEATIGSVDVLLRVSDHIGKLGHLEMRLNKEDKQADPFRLF